MSRSLRRRLAAQTANGTLKRIRAVSRDKYTDYFTKYGVFVSKLNLFVTSRRRAQYYVRSIILFGRMVPALFAAEGTNPLHAQYP